MSGVLHVRWNLTVADKHTLAKKLPSIEGSGSTAKHAHSAAVISSMFTLKACIIVLAALVIVGGLGIGFASAGNMGIFNATAQVGEAGVTKETTFADASATTASNEAFILETAAQRDMSAAIEELEAWEEYEKSEARVAEKRCIAQAEEAQAASAASGGVGVYDVDFSVGRDAFIDEWTGRINAYLAGSALAGYGEEFATAAWNYGVDPRWSPAISNTESGKGAHCFASHNAWGWTGGSWGDWSSAIDAHVAGLAKGYGYTISYYNASVYCPPNTAYWYSSTLSEMMKI